MSSSACVSKETIKRLATDVRQLHKNPLTEHGIYYVHDESDLLKGYAMIIGPSETPYAYGYYFFEFIFPYDYPYSPPKVKFRSNFDRIRFNPNLYRDGKVCISLLNTWRGEQWTSCQTITSILLTMCGSISNDKPLLNEPGINESHKDHESYNEIIAFKNIQRVICSQLTSTISIFIELFHDDMKKLFCKNIEHIKDIVKSKIEKYPESIVLTTCLYDMTVPVCYKTLNEQLNFTYNNIK